MKKKTLVVYNKTPTPLSIAKDGKQIVLEGFSERIVSDEVASLFFKFHRGSVVPADKFEETITTSVTRPATLWIANVTGNTEAPKTIKVKERENKQWVWKDATNPEHVPMVLKEEMNGRWEEAKDAEGELTAIRHKDRTIAVPPFKRIEMLAGVARWFVNRSYMSLPQVEPGTQVRKAIIARAPTGFEPDGSWSHDELRAYLQYIDPAAKVPLSEEELEKRERRKKNVSEEDVQFGLENARRELFKRVFFRIVDPSWPNPLPNRKEFEEYMHGTASKPKVNGNEVVDEVLDSIQPSAE